ncbi:hypothetical protein DFA_06689 [Cavenderia fasciculata]|uniref:FNIP repeat-containing protein n=1 Tax=Cavenderia fasciculata TaxID=261658 RepID=F4Q203_CACFS|nr:uncharacterized protein DFA_06689 [Cavenderia fasciculata]EGG18023.1 hypothetical protein DFA_06689 [Cavenderia fasciculata]|eukprot:XP_004356916.1 hypothetical protein DFA_06689 [Cavenderia fasciculata]
MNDTTDKTKDEIGSFIRLVKISDLIILDIISFIDNNVDVICLLLTCKSLYNGIRLKIENICKEFNQENKNNNINNERDKYQLYHPLPPPHLLTLFKNVKSVSLRPTPNIDYDLAHNCLRSFVNIHNTGIFLSTRKFKIVNDYNLNEVVEQCKIPDYVETMVLQCAAEIDTKYITPSVKSMGINMIIKPNSFPTIKVWPPSITSLAIGEYTTYGKEDFFKKIAPTLLKLKIRNCPPKLDIRHLKSLVSLEVSHNPLAGMINFSKRVGPSSIGDILIPKTKTMKKLTIGGLDGITTGFLPPNLEKLTISHQTKTFKLPSTLTYLDIGYSPILVPNTGFIPSSVRELHITFPKDTDLLEPGVVPNGVERLLLNQYYGPIDSSIPDTVTDLSVRWRVIEEEDDDDEEDEEDEEEQEEDDNDQENNT